MPITGASGGIIGADNTPSCWNWIVPLFITSTGCYSPTSTTATVVVVGWWWVVQVAVVLVVL